MLGYCKQVLDKLLPPHHHTTHTTPQPSPTPKAAPTHTEVLTLVNDLVGQDIAEEVGLKYLHGADLVTHQATDKVNMEEAANEILHLAVDESSRDGYRNSDSNSGDDDSPPDSPSVACTPKGNPSQCHNPDCHRSECRQPNGQPREGHQPDCHQPECHPCDGHPIKCHPADCHQPECHPCDGHPIKCHPADCRSPKCCPQSDQPPECHPPGCRPLADCLQDSDIDLTEFSASDSEDSQSEEDDHEQNGCSQKRKFPSTDPNLKAFVRYIKIMGHTKASIDLDVARVSECFYFVQDEVLEGKVPDMLDVDAIHDTAPFSHYFQKLSETFSSSTIIAYAQSLKRFLKYIDYEKNKYGKYSYAICHMNDYLRLILECQTRIQRKKKIKNQYLKESLNAGQPDIDYFRSRYRQLWPDMKALVNQYKDINSDSKSEEDFTRPTVQEYSDVTQYMLAMVMIDHGHRPAVVENMTVSEVANATVSTDEKYYTILVLNHRTGASKPSTISLKTSEYNFMKRYYKYVRGRYLEGDEDPITSKFFRNFHGKPYEKAAGDAVKRFHKRHSMPQISSTQSRKAQEETNKKNLCDKDRLLVRKYMSQSPVKEEASNRQTDIQDAVKARQIQLGEQEQAPECSVDASVWGETQAVLKRLRPDSESIEEAALPRKRLKQEAGGLLENTANQTHQGQIPDEIILRNIKEQSWVGIQEKCELDHSCSGVVTTQSFAEGDIVCDYNGILLNGQQTREYLDDSSYVQTDKCLTFCVNEETWMVDAHQEPADIGLKPSYGRLINRCKKYPNVTTQVCMIDDKPHVLVVCLRPVQPGRELHLDDRDMSTQTKSLRSKDCICKNCVGNQGEACKTKSLRSRDCKSVANQEKAVSWKIAKQPFGMSNKSISSMVHEMETHHVSDDPPPRKLLKKLTKSVPESVRGPIKKALSYHWHATKINKLIRSGARLVGVPAFRIISKIEETGQKPTEMDIVSMLGDMKVGCSGSGGRHKRETRTKMAATYFSVLQDVYTEQEGDESSTKTTNKRKRNKNSDNRTPMSKRKMKDKGKSGRTKDRETQPSACDVLPKTSKTKKHKRNVSDVCADTGDGPHTTQQKEGEGPGESTECSEQDITTGTEFTETCQTTPGAFQRGEARRKLDFENQLTKKKSRLKMYLPMVKESDFENLD